jgi:ATP-dependent DNA ligase
MSAARPELISRRRNVYKSFAGLRADLNHALAGHTALLDGEIVCLDPEGRPQFYDLLRHRGEAFFYAFDLLWLDGRDLRPLPLVDRKAQLEHLIPADSRLHRRQVEAGAVPGRAQPQYDLGQSAEPQLFAAHWP